MATFDFLQMFNRTTVKVSCPVCKHITEQKRNRFRENVTVMCPKCGLYFLPRGE
ncbi:MULTISPECIES: YnfU family zinc-binding protein [Pectobacterium]|nr:MULTISPECIES: YnfU family zinc-binding protein [Pectobacterium]MCA5931144.1 YnfU family zinc-binding protein [Pectobacterium versatile]MCA5948340.1 YnfU family zinc-binding protein [Pectobacterium versatile]MCA5952439.1 YnfU family zinc-binding protein [Pectobacterium versatile]MCA6914612.1 YnfU family zinc-binding protein [Pectobacterium versatile]MCA6925364.1 YnfU family zinc-binding protein [Pectobacterium versatile]